MRVRFGVAMAEHGGRAAIAGVEVTERRLADGRLEHRFYVGSLERPEGTIEAVAARTKELVRAAQEVRPCAVVDVGTPQGMALRQHMRDSLPSALHRPHAYPGTGSRRDLFAGFLGAYASGRIEFAPGLPFRKELDKALVFYLAGDPEKNAGKSSVKLTSEEEALVVALGLALVWPRHGPAARAG